MNSEKASELLNKISYNVIEEYEKYLSYLPQEHQKGILQLSIQNKKVILKDTDLNFTKKIRYAYANEEKEFDLFVGKCVRKTFFEWVNVFKYDNEYLKIQKIANKMKEEFISFLEQQNKIKQKNYDYTLESKDFKISGIVDAIYFKGNQETILHFESIKNNFYVKDNESFEGKPMQRHLIKIIPSMIALNLPATLIYQDRGTMELNKYEISFGENYKILINGIEYDDFTLNDILNNIQILFNDIVVNGCVPARSYKPYKKDDLFILSKNKLINKKESDEIFAGLKVYPFDCNKCVFKNICDPLPEESFK